MTSHSPASSPELPKLPSFTNFSTQSLRDDFTNYGRACYEAGSAAAALAAWRPIGWQFRFVFPTHASNWHTVLKLPVTDMHSGDDHRFETRLVYAAAPTGEQA